MKLLSRLPIMPLYYNGETKFSPIHVLDLVNIINDLIIKDNNNLILECIGPDTLSFKEIILKLLKSIGKKRILIPLPYTIAKLSAKFFSFSKPSTYRRSTKIIKV